MNGQQVELYERIRTFSFDAPGTAYTFVQRLAKENAWSRPYAERVVDEYRRFAFLAVAAGHPVSPSDAVDQAWHLHLVYTRSYWDEFCSKVLHTPLHHEPGRGGEKEVAKFDDWYARTLASYAKFFGEGPPADVWLTVLEKAARREEFRRVDVKRHWVLSKRKLGIGVAAALLALSLGLAAFGCMPATFAKGRPAVSPPFAAATLNPFDLRGPDFLAFYGIAYVAAFALAWVVRSASRGPDGAPRRGIHLDPYQIAYLNGGAVHAVNAAITALYHRDVLKVTESDGTLQVLRPGAALPHPLEQAVYRAVDPDGREGRRRQVSDVRLIVRPTVEQVGAGLKKAGLVVNDDDARAAAVRATLVALAVPMTGLVKVMIGLSRDKPVSFLVLAVIATAVLAVAVLSRRPHRTRLGDAALRALRSVNDPLRTNVMRVGPEALVLGVALFGLGMLGNTNLEFLNRTLRPRNQSTFSSSGCGGATSCGGFSCGGSSCGGGGCGGGGCGGCGGS